jgi:hypothetical protein
MNTVLHTAVAVQLVAIDVKAAITDKLFNRETNERGEGVISAAIAVMIMAVLGAAMYAFYKILMGKAEVKTTTAIDGITP